MRQASNSRRSRASRKHTSYSDCKPADHRRGNSPDPDSNSSWTPATRNTKTSHPTTDYNCMPSAASTSRHPRMAIRSPNLPNPSQDAILGPDRSLAKSLSNHNHPTDSLCGRARRRCHATPGRREILRPSRQRSRGASYLIRMWSIRIAGSQREIRTWNGRNAIQREANCR